MRRITLSLGLPIVSLSLLVAAACGSSQKSGFAPGAGASPDGGGALPGPFADDAGARSDALPPSIGDVTGKVVAPEGTIPIAGALVYLTSSPPPPIPSGVYCDKCVLLDSYAFTYSKADGTFDLPAYDAGDQYLVTQKGQFRRVRKITVHPGAQAAPSDDTRLPGKNDAANGDTIPKMKVMQATWDAIASSLNKLGITEFDGPPAGLTIDRTLEDPALATQYHIIFIPCSGTPTQDDPTGLQCSGIYAPDAPSTAAMREFIQRGGKLYVTDWSYEYVRQIWPGFVHFAGEDSRVGSACTLGDYSGPAQWNDPDLGAWMQAIGEGNAQLEKNYVQITGTAPQPGLDENGAPATITPKVWASTMVGGAPKISTVSFQDQCGRVMYSTYHAEGTDNGGSTTLLAQEKALLYVLLEVSACVGTKPEPPIK